MSSPSSQPAPKTGQGKQKPKTKGGPTEVGLFQALPPFEGLSPLRLSIISALLMGNLKQQSDPEEATVDLDRVSQAVKTAVVMWNRSAQSVNPGAFEVWRRDQYRKPLKFVEIAELKLMSRQRKDGGGEEYVKSPQGIRPQVVKYFDYLKKELDKALAKLPGSEIEKSRYKQSFLDKLKSISSRGGAISLTILEHLGATRRAGFKGAVRAHQLDAILELPKELSAIDDF